MKRFLSVFPVLLIVCAGIVMMSCPSDPPPPISDFNIELKDAKLQYVFETPKIEHGKLYEIILTIEKCDSGLIGSHLGGKICYKMDMASTDPDEEKLLSGWQNPQPNQVTNPTTPKTFKWTFEAGEQYSDSVTVEEDATTPDGATQYFLLMAQQDTPNWDNYPAGTNFRIKGSITIREADSVAEWISEGTVALGNADGVAGKGNLSDDDMAKIRALPSGSQIEITVTVTVDSSTNAKPGWGTGSIGTWVSEESLAINIPGNASDGSLTFKVKFDIDTILGIVGSDAIAINLWNDATASKAELFKPGITFESAGTLTLGNEDGVAGKGNFTETDMAKIDAAPANSYITLTVHTTVGTNPQAGWGVATIGGWGDGEGISINVPGNAADGDCTFTVNVKISDIRLVYPTGAIAINTWNPTTVTKAELFKPKS